MAQIKALIFDFDGLLVNTQDLMEIAVKEFLKRRGKKLKRRDYAVMMGRPGIVNMKFLKRKYRLEGKAEDLYKERKEISRKLFDDQMVLMEGVDDLFRRMRSWDLKYAIASGGRREIILPALKKFGINWAFSVIVTAEDLVESNGKPDPEIFLMAANELEINPEACVVLEDAPNGIEGAKAAGMKAVFVPNSRFTDTNHDEADVILENLHGVTEDLIRSLGNK